MASRTQLWQSTTSLPPSPARRRPSRHGRAGLPGLSHSEGVNERARSPSSERALCPYWHRLKDRLRGTLRLHNVAASYPFKAYGPARHQGGSGMLGRIAALIFGILALFGLFDKST